jgi:hypothetical protein
MAAVRRWPRGVRLAIILAVCAAAVVLLCLQPRIPLGPHYHQFADTRALLGIPNCMNVLSNIPFLVAGLMGLAWLTGRGAGASFLLARERAPYYVFFAGVTLTGAGSLWYHLSPGNARLPWDLLPMTCSFMSIVMAQVMERISIRAGFVLFAPLLLLGLASVLYWQYSEAQGRGDYRFYLFVQFFSPVVLAMIVTLFPPRYTGTRYLVIAFLLFVVAKIFELFDSAIYTLTGFVSGHSLKHATAGISCYWILLWLQRRRPVAGCLEAPRAGVASERRPVSL